MKVPRFYRRVHLKTIFCAFIVIIIFYYFLSMRGMYNQNHVDLRLIYEELHQTNESSLKSYIVSTSTCNIPDFHPWDSSVQLLSTKCEPSDEVDPKCHERKVRRWMYGTASDLVVNLTEIHASGYSWSALHCCYHVIERVEQPLDNYDTNADSVIRYSSKCHPIKNSRQRVTDEFIRVYCIATSVPLLEDVVYRELFAFPQLDKQVQGNISSSKEKSQISGSSSFNSPPNVVIIGIDTNSRLNSHRRLKKTLEVLKGIGAVEMFGYTKVGENTFPNTVAFLTGMDTKEMQPLCLHSDDDPQDDCPYVWKDFKNAGYLTSTIEDVPYAAGFNYLKTGFLRKPCDFYLRPFLLGVMMQPREHVWFAKCVGRYYIEELLLKYMKDVLDTGSKASSPVFIHSWFAVMSHHCINSPRFRDRLIATFLETVNKTNTVLILMSDHGDRYGKFRETALGWYEDKLPTIWIYLPPALRENFPSWEQSLRINSRRLSSHFDLYQTFTHLIRTFRSDVILQESFTPTIRRKGQSFLEPIPENRTCESAGIPSAYCACTEPQTLEISGDNKNVLLNAAAVAITFLEQNLPKECAKPVLKEIVSGKVMKMPRVGSIYVISMYTDPGNFLFEVTLKSDGDTKGFVIETLDDLLRMNKIERKVNCVSSPVIERYCYCL